MGPCIVYDLIALTTASGPEYQLLSKEGSTYPKSHTPKYVRSCEMYPFRCRTVDLEGCI